MAPLEVAPAMSRPPVSILIRTRNRPQLLAEALASVAVQSMPGLEVVVVNDGGCDVGELLARPHGAIATFQYIHWPDGRGRSHAANALLEAAQGECLLFLDDDDWLDAAHIGRLWQRLQHHPQAVAAYADVACVRRDASQVWQTVRVFAEPFDVLRLAYENFLPIHAVLFRREVVSAGCRFDPELDAYEDWAFWLQLARQGEFVHQPGVSAFYRLDSGAGFGVPESAAQISRQNLLRFVRSVRDVWSDEQLVALLGLFGYKHRCTELERIMEAQQHELGRLQQDLNAMRASTSWRVTAPLRWLVNRLKYARRK